jgi:DNA-binding MarR family transcriptional regulator
MSAQDPRSSSNGNGTDVTLGLLSAVDNDSTITQRSLALDLGIALGMANTYLKRCVKKGFIKITQVPANRYAYFLTPQGLAEKSRLTAEFLSQSFKLFRMARAEYSQIIEQQLLLKRGKIAIFGGSDLTEIIFLCAREFNINLVGLVAPGYLISETTDVPIVDSVSDLDYFDIIIIANLVDPQNTYDNLVNILGPKRVIAPNFLNITQNSLQNKRASLS